MTEFEIKYVYDETYEKRVLLKAAPPSPDWRMHQGLELALMSVEMPHSAERRGHKVNMVKKGECQRGVFSSQSFKVYKRHRINVFSKIYSKPCKSHWFTYFTFSLET